MKVYKMIEMARNNDPEAKIWLDEHYEPIIRNYVLNKYGQEAASKMVEMLPSLINYYFEHNIKDKLSSFLAWKADIFYKEKKERVKKTITNIIYEKFGFSLKKDDFHLSLRQLGFDSIKTVSLIVEIENKYSKIIPDQFLVESRFYSINSVINVMLEVFENE